MKKMIIKNEGFTLVGRDYSYQIIDSSGRESWVHKNYALALANAIYDDLGKGWKPYPQEKPEDFDDYLCWMEFGGDEYFTVLVFEPDKNAFSDGEAWYDEKTEIKVRAWQVPQPYEGE